MKIVQSIADLRATLAAAFDANNNTHRVGFVPTMGNLHSGHIALVKQARAISRVTVASIFVNRLQFLPHEDFDSYPRTFEADCAQLEAAGCDVLFAPREGDLYPEPQTFKVHAPTEIADILEGEFRLGFFTGVSTVVMKLFACVQPQVAVFGQKDYQQLMVIRRMVQQFALPIEIIGGSTERAEDGLALSSRNGYLSAAERTEAIWLSRCLRQMIEDCAQGISTVELEQRAMQTLRERGWQPDYMTLRRRADLAAPLAQDLQTPNSLVVLGAAKLGKTRLIDNLEF